MKRLVASGNITQDMATLARIAEETGALLSVDGGSVRVESEDPKVVGPLLKALGDAGLLEVLDLEFS